jgi:predicted nuclease with TOPRIM domain
LFTFHYSLFTKMSCTTAVFSLMTGAALIAGAMVFFFLRHKITDLHHKNNTLNTALSSLQDARSELIIKNEDLFVENATLSAEMSRLKDKCLSLKTSVERLERDNNLIAEAYTVLKERSH